MLSSGLLSEWAKSYQVKNRQFKQQQQQQNVFFQPLQTIVHGLARVLGQDRGPEDEGAGTVVEAEAAVGAGAGTGGIGVDAAGGAAAGAEIETGGVARDEIAGRRGTEVTRGNALGIAIEAGGAETDRQGDEMKVKTKEPHLEREVEWTRKPVKTLERRGEGPRSNHLRATVVVRKRAGSDR